MAKNIKTIFDKINQELDLDIQVEEQYWHIAPTEVCMDSRNIYENSIFVAYKGERFDSHDYLDGIRDKGAVVCVVERKIEGLDLPQIVVSHARQILPWLSNLVYETNEHPMNILAMAGTDGKTTCAHMTAHILNYNKVPTASIGTIGTTIPGRGLIPQRVTSPEAPQFHRLLREIRASGVQTVVVEAASHAMSQKRFETVDFIGASFTNFSQDHMDYYKTIPPYAEAKKSLYDSLAEDVFVLANAANPSTYYMLQDFPGEVLFFRTAGKSYLGEWEANPNMKAWDEYVLGLRSDEEMDTWVEKEGLLEGANIRRETKGLRFDLHYYPGTEYSRFPRDPMHHEVFLPMWGEHNVDNCLTSVGVAMGMGISLEDAVASLESFPGVPSRVQFIDAGQDFTVIADFAHTPAAVEALLKEASLNKGDKKLWVTATAAGGRDKDKRIPMGRLYSQYADEVLLTTDKIHNENPNQVLDEVAEGFIPGTQYKRFLLRTDAIRYGIEHMDSGDIFLLLGTAKLFLPINDKILPWNEAEYARSIILERLMREETLKFAQSFEEKEEVD